MKEYYIKRNDFIGIQEIMFLQAAENYTLFYLKDGTKLMSSTTLKRHEEKLSEDSFLRVNRSTLINSLYVRKVVLRNDTNFIKMLNGHEIKVSRRRRDTLLDLVS